MCKDVTIRSCGAAGLSKLLAEAWPPTCAKFENFIFSIQEADSVRENFIRAYVDYYNREARQRFVVISAKGHNSIRQSLHYVLILYNFRATCFERFIPEQCFNLLTFLTYSIILYI